MRVRIAHSPDPDDAFMAWGLAAGRVRVEGFEVEIVPRDIQSLNERALGSDPLEVTALSLAAYARVANRYHLLTHGASFAEGIGPCVVSSAPLRTQDLPGTVIAVPGELTTAFAALKLAIGPFDYDVLPFDEILPAVRSGEFDAGLIIHEGQLTYAREGLHKVMDLAEWWAHETGLPLPLGVVAVRKDLGPGVPERLSTLLRASIEAALKERPLALAHAKEFGRGITMEEADRFVEMYVSPLTLDMGARGKHAILEFLARGAAAGVLRANHPPTFIA